MSTRAAEKERLRNHRLKREESEQERQRWVLLSWGGVAVLAVCVIALLIALSLSSSQGGDGDIDGAGEVAADLEGIQQQGTVLGSQDADVTVVEFGDLQCPVCRDYSGSVIAPLIAGPVSAGEARLEFRNWVILGPESGDAAAAAYAAAEQDRYWNFVELYYRNQGLEHSGYVTDEFLRSVAEGAGVPNLDRWEKDRANGRWDAVIAKTDRQAKLHGFSGTPSFLVIGPHGSEALGTPHSAAHVEAAIARAG